MKTKFTKTSIIWIALAILMLNLSSCKDNVVEKGKTGLLLWELTDDGVLTISGTGEMLNYMYDDMSDFSDAPWYPYRHAVKTVVINNGVTHIGDFVFFDCYNLRAVSISNTVTSIGNFAFSECSGLKSVIIGNGVETIGDRAFAHCVNLKDITLSNTVIYIGYYAFATCYSLTDISIPNSVTDIGDWAFYGCYDLKSITIGSSVRSIGWWAFSGINALTEMTVKATVPPTIDPYSFGVYVFGSFVNYTIPVYVPQESLELYKNADVWKEFTNLQGKVF